MAKSKPGKGRGKPKAISPKIRKAMKAKAVEVQPKGTLKQIMDKINKGKGKDDDGDHFRDA